MPAGYKGQKNGRLFVRVRKSLRAKDLRVETVHPRCRDEQCRDRFHIKLPGGKEGIYHPDLFVSSRFWLEIKSGVGYNLDSLFRVTGAAAKAGSRYLVVGDLAFARSFDRWKSVVPGLSRARVRLLVFPDHEDELLTAVARQ